MAFNLTAQLNLRGPTNVKQIAAQIKKDLGNINANVTFKLDPAAIKNTTALSSSLKTLNSTFSSTVASANSATAAIKAFGNSVGTIKIGNIPQQIKATANSVNSLNKAASSSSQNLGAAAAEMQEFGKQAGLAVRRFVAFSSVTSIIYGVTNSISQGVQAFIDYDKELVKLQQVTGDSAVGLAKLQSQITNLSVTFGVSSKDLTSVASTLAQAGLSANDTTKALRALALSSLAPSFDDMNETVEGSIALMRQFGISAGDLEAALGSINSVAARFAVESADIVTAIQRTGSVFATASKGVSEGKDALNEFISVFTSVRSTTRESAETIATGLRTIFTRIQRGSTIDALKEFGVNLTDVDGKFVGAYKAVELLSSGLSNLDPRSLDFSRIVEELGGFRQIGKVIPLIQQFTVTQEALKVAQAGQGSLAKDAATAQLSLANQISKVREEFFALFREIGQSKGFQTLIRGALSLVSGLIKVTDAVKGILPALAVITAFKGVKALTEFSSGFGTGVKRGPDGKANGGVIRKFARGGVVPGTGSGDTVPAMLEPGEFVIRKKAVETIGADNLHGMNKYGGGGSIRGGRAGKRQKFGAGGAARIDKIESVDDFKDGDTFVATVRPKVETYKEEIRIAEWDAWELENKYNKGFSKVGTVTKFDDIKKLNSDKKILKLFNKTNREQKKIPGNAFVNKNNETALQLAEQATGELKKVVGKSLDGMSAEKAGILENRDQTRNARLLIKGINIEEKYKTGRKFNFGGKIQKFMAGGNVDTPKLIQRGTLSYSLEDILKAGLTEEQFLEKIPVPPPLMAINPKPGEYGTQFKIGGVGSGSVPMPKFLTPYSPPDTAAFQSSQDAVFKRSEASAEYRKKKGLMPRDYEGKSSTEKSFLAARERGYNWGGMVQKFMAGGKTEPAPFGTGATKFPKRITNAYVKEMHKKLNDEQVSLAWDQYPKDERINIDQGAVAEQFKSQAFDRKKFESLFKTKIRRNDLVGDLANFAKYIGLPEQDLSKVLPQSIDFGGVGQNVGARGTFYANAYGARDFDKLDLSQYGFSEADEQDLFGYEKLFQEKEKEIKKIMKTPTKTFDDGSFSIDDAAFKKAYDEKTDIHAQISKVKDKRAYARKAAMAAKKEITDATGRGTVGLSSTRFAPNQEKNTLYHELTHQLLNSIRTQSSGAFDKYKDRVTQLFSGDNDGLADAFDALTEKDGGYNSADIVYGRSYKNKMLDSVLGNLRRDTIRTGRSDNPEVLKDGSALYFEAEKKKNAREYRPINPKITDLLLKGGVGQDVVNKAEDHGKEEFLTTLIQKRPTLDSNMEGILDSTLNELLGNAGIQRQQYAEGGKVQRNIGIIDTDVLRDPANADIVGPAMEKLGITDVSEYSRTLAQMSAQARKTGSLSKLSAIAGSAGSGKSSLATGRGSNDNASLRQTTRSSILTPEDITKASEVMVLTSTASELKLDAYLKDVDRAYVLSSNERSEQDRVGSNRQSRDNTGEGLYGRKPGTTNSASRDFALEESILRDELGDKAMVLGRKPDSFGLRRKKESELPEIVQAGGYYTGGFAPPTKGHRGAFDTLLSNMISRNPNASAEDIIVSVAPNLSMNKGEGDTAADQLAHASRYGIFPADFRTLLAGINFPKGMISAGTESTGRGDILPKMMEVQGTNGRRKFAKLKGALAITSGKKAGALDKYEKAGVDVTDIPRIEDISATKVRKAVIDGDDKALTSFVSPEVASVLMGNRPQLRNRSTMVPMLIEEITKYGATQKAQTNAEIQQLLANAPGGPYGKITKTARENAPDVVAQVEAMREQRDALSSSLLGYRAHNIISLLSAKYPDAYGLDPSRRSSVSVQPSDLTKEAISAQLSESMSGEFGGVSTAMPSSGLQEAILKNVEKSTQVKKSSGILPAQGTEILKRFGTERLPNDPSFGPFSGKTVRDTADGGKLKYWNSAFRPETKADKLAYYTATRDYLIDKFNQSQGTKSAQALSDTTSAVLSSQQLGLVGLNPLGYTGLLGPETWNLGTDPSGQERSIDASIVQRGLPNQYQNVIDYLSGQTEEIVGGASKLMGISPKKLSKKQRETLGQGNIEGALLEQIFGSAGADILDDALRTRPIDFPMGIGPKAASIFGIDPDIPTEVKRTIDSGSRGKAVEEFQRYFRQQYGIPDPEKEVVKLAGGGPVKLYHGSNSGPDDSVLNNFKENGILSSMASGYGQGSGFFMWSDRDSAMSHAKTLIDPNSNMITSAKTGGRPMVVEATEVLNPKNWDLDYELQSKNVVDYIYANFDNLKPLLEKSQGVDLGDNLKNFQLRNKIDEYVDPNDNTTMRKVQIGFDDENKEVRRTLANTTGDLRTGQVVGKLVQALRMGDPNVLDSFESDFFSNLQPGTALKYVGSSPLKPSNIETFASGGKAGLSQEDTVPALLTPGEFVINKKAAQNIGYGKLEKLNKADKIQGFNKGGAVGGVIQNFAEGGTVQSILMSILKGFSQPAVQKLQSRPDTISSKTVQVSSELFSSIRSLTAGFEEAGYSMLSFKKVLEQVGAGAEMSYKDIEKAMTKDVERLKITGASIDIIIQAEKALQTVRNKSKTSVANKQFLEAGFKEGSVGKKLGSGATQQKIIQLAAKEEERLVAKRKKTIETDIVSSSKKPLSAGDLAEQVQKQLDSELSDIKSKSFVTATKVATGTKTSTGIKGGITEKELEALNISGADIQSYVSQSMTDRKTLAQMDKQLIAMKIDDLKASSQYISASAAEQAKLLQATQKLAQEEIGTRRKMLNDMAAEQGTAGVGAAGLMDFQNSPILNKLKDRYASGTFAQGASTAVGDVGMAAGLIGGQGQNIANAMYDKTTDASKVGAAKTGALIEQTGSTLATGLTTASQLMLVNPYLGALAAVATVSYAVADGFLDFSGAQAEAVAAMEDSLRADKIASATDKLSTAFDELGKDSTNLAAKLKVAAAMQQLTEFKKEDINKDFDKKKTEDEGRNWQQWFMGGGVATALGLQGKNRYDKNNANQYSVEDYKRAAIEQSGQFSEQGSMGYTMLRDAYKQGFTTENINDPNNEATQNIRNSATAMALSQPQNMERYQMARRQGEDQGDAALKDILSDFFSKDIQALQIKKSEEMARAMELANRAGRRLAESFEKLSKNVNESVNRVQFESDVRRSTAEASRSALRGESSDSGPKLRETNILDNPNAYSEKDFNDALVTATQGLDEKTRNQLIGGSQLEQTLPKAMTVKIEEQLKTNRDLDVDSAKEQAIKVANEQIDKTSLSDEQKTSLKEQAKTRINDLAEKSKEKNADPQAQTDFFVEELQNASNVLGDFGKKTTDAVKALLSFKEKGLGDFAKDLQNASKAAKDSQNYFKKARDIGREGDMNLRQVMTGVGETYDEKKSRITGDVAALAGGETTPQGIKNRLVNLQAQRENLVGKRDSSTNENDSANFTRDIDKVDNSLRDTREALDSLADGTELVEKAFDDLKNVTELQKSRQSFVNSLLTNTPEETDKLNQSLIRLQRNLSGGLNTAGNQRDARKAFNQTLRETGSVREATRSGNTVLANQRKETLAAAQDPGFRAAQELNIRNQYAQNKGQPGVNADQAVADYFKQQDLQLTKSLAIESGMINNPLVQQSIKAMEDPNEDEAVKKSAATYLEAVGLKSGATKAQGELALIESQQALKSANDNLSISIDNLRTTIEASMGGGGARDVAADFDAYSKATFAGTDRLVSPGVTVSKPVAKGGLIYASEGQLVNFQPQGTDTVPAMLTPGEFVINARSTAAHLPLLQAINSGYYSKGGVVYLQKGSDSEVRRKQPTTVIEDYANEVPFEIGRYRRGGDPDSMPLGSQPEKQVMSGAEYSLFMDNARGVMSAAAPDGRAIANMQELERVKPRADNDPKDFFDISSPDPTRPQRDSRDYILPAVSSATTMEDRQSSDDARPLSPTTMEDRRSSNAIERSTNLYLEATGLMASRGDTKPDMSYTTSVVEPSLPVPLVKMDTIPYGRGVALKVRPTIDERMAEERRNKTKDRNARMALNAIHPDKRTRDQQSRLDPLMETQPNREEGRLRAIGRDKRTKEENEAYETLREERLAGSFTVSPEARKAYAKVEERNINRARREAGLPPTGQNDVLPPPKHLVEWSKKEAERGRSQEAENKSRETRSIIDPKFTTEGRRIEEGESLEWKSPGPGRLDSLSGQDQRRRRNAALSGSPVNDYTLEAAEASSAKRKKAAEDAESKRKMAESTTSDTPGSIASNPATEQREVAEVAATERKMAEDQTTATNQPVGPATNNPITERVRAGLSPITSNGGKPDTIDPATVARINASYTTNMPLQKPDPNDPKYQTRNPLKGMDQRIADNRAYEAQQKTVDTQTKPALTKPDPNDPKYQTRDPLEGLSESVADNRAYEMQQTQQREEARRSYRFSDLASFARRGRLKAAQAQPSGEGVSDTSIQNPATEQRQAAETAAAERKMAEDQTRVAGQSPSPATSNPATGRSERRLSGFGEAEAKGDPLYKELHELTHQDIVILRFRANDPQSMSGDRWHNSNKLAKAGYRLHSGEDHLPDYDKDGKLQQMWPPPKPSVQLYPTREQREAAETAATERKMRYDAASPPSSAASPPSSAASNPAATERVRAETAAEERKVTASPGLSSAIQTATTSSDSGERAQARNRISGSKMSIENRAQIAAQEQAFDDEFNQKLESSRSGKDPNTYGMEDDPEDRENYKKARRKQVIDERNKTKIDEQTRRIDSSFDDAVRRGSTTEDKREDYRKQMRGLKHYEIRLEQVASYQVPTSEQLAQDQANSEAIAQFEGATAAEKVRAQQQKAEEDRKSLYINSSNPAVAALGYVGGVTQGVGDALYGGANIAAGAVATVASPIVGGIGYALSGNNTAVKVGDENNLRNRTAENMYDEARANGRPMPSPQEIASAQDAAAIRARAFTANSDRLNNQQGAYSAATSAAADVGLRAMGAGVTSFGEAGLAVAGMGPIQTGDQTALQRNDARNVELAGGMDSYLGFGTAFAQTAGYAASQGVGAVVNAEGAVVNAAGRMAGAAGRVASRIPGAASVGRAASRIPGAASVGRVAGTVDRAITSTARGAGRLASRIPGARTVGRATNNFVEGVQDVAGEVGNVLGVRGITPNYSRPNLNRSSATSPYKNIKPAKPVTFAESAPTKVRSIDDINPLEYDGNYGRLADKAKAARSKALNEKLSNIDLSMPTSGSPVKPKITAAQYQEIQDLINQGVPESLATSGVLGKATKPSVLQPVKPTVSATSKPKITAKTKSKPGVPNKPKATATPKSASYGRRVFGQNPGEEFIYRGSYGSSIEEGFDLTKMGSTGSVYGAGVYGGFDLTKAGQGKKLAQNYGDQYLLKFISENPGMTADQISKNFKGGMYKLKLKNPELFADAGAAFKGTREESIINKLLQKSGVDTSTVPNSTTSIQAYNALSKRYRKQLASLPQNKGLSVKELSALAKAKTSEEFAKAGIPGFAAYRNPTRFADGDGSGVVSIFDQNAFDIVSKTGADADKVKQVVAKSKKAPGFSGGGLVRYYEDGGHVDDHDSHDSHGHHGMTVSTMATNAATTGLAAAGTRGKNPFNLRTVGSLVDAKLGTGHTATLVGEGIDMIGEARHTAHSVGHGARVFGLGTSSTAAATGIGAAAAYGGYAATSYVGEAAAILSGEKTSEDYAKENDRQRQQGYAQNVGENMFSPGRAAAQLVVETESTTRQMADNARESEDIANRQKELGASGVLTPQYYTEAPEYKAAAQGMPSTPVLNTPSPKLYNSGGMIYANNGALVPSLSQGTDTVPAMLTPGEFVINREASQKHMPLLNAINSGHFNRGGIINYLANGGIVAPKYYAEAGVVSGGSGGNSGVSNDISSSISAAVGQAMNEAVGQLGNTLKSGAETYGQMMQSSTEILNNFGQTFSNATQSFGNSAAGFSRSADAIPNTLDVQGSITKVVQGGENIIERSGQAGQMAGNQAGQLSGRVASQNTVAKYDREQFEGNLNTAKNNSPMRG